MLESHFRQVYERRTVLIDGTSISWSGICQCRPPQGVAVCTQREQQGIIGLARQELLGVEPWAVTIESLLPRARRYSQVHRSFWEENFQACGIYIRQWPSGSVWLLLRMKSQRR